MTNETAETFETPPPADQPADRPGVLGLLWDVIVEPRTAFANAGSRSLWLVLWIAFCVVYFGANYPIQSIRVEEAISQMERSLSANDQMTAEQKEEMLEGTRRWMQGWISSVVDAVSHLVVLFIVSAILLFIANIVLGGNGRYMQFVNAYSLVFVISAIGVIVNSILIYSKGSADVQLGLGVLASEGTGPFVKAVLAAINVFAVWQLWLSAEVVSVIGKVSLRRSFPVVATVWAIFVLMMAGLAQIGTSMVS